jgi:hypothetical protein
MDTDAYAEQFSFDMAIGAPASGSLIFGCLQAYRNSRCVGRIADNPREGRPRESGFQTARR